MARIRQIVFAARDLDKTVAQFERELGLTVAYRDPLVAEFGLRNALMVIGDQFVEVVSPTRENTAAGRHIERHGDSAYMLILQTDDLDRDRARLKQLGVRLVWQADYPDIRAVHLHPKDIGGAIVSLDQPTPPESWRWAGPDWQKHSKPGQISHCSIGAVDPHALQKRWSEVLGMHASSPENIALTEGSLTFEKADNDLIRSYQLQLPNQPAKDIEICSTHFQLR